MTMISEKYNEQIGNYLAKLAKSKPKQTNADRIRSMTDEELADKVMAFIRCEACEREFHINCDVLKTCRGNWLDWLKQEVTE